MAAAHPRVKHLVFVEGASDARWMARARPDLASAHLVAVTADAAQALEEARLPHRPICAYGDSRRLPSVERELNTLSHRLASRIERYIGERYPGADRPGPGFLSGQGYYIQYSTGAIAARGFLMREAIRACRPERVTVVEGEVHSWFEGDGYDRNPWTDLVAEPGEYAFEAVRTPRRWNLQLPSARRLARGIWTRRRSVRDAFLRRFGRYGASPAGGSRPLRVLVVDLGYDWRPVAEATRGEIEWFELKTALMDSRAWTMAFRPSVCPLAGRPIPFETDDPEGDASEAAALGALFDEWSERYAAAESLNVLGLDLTKPLLPHLRALAVRGPEIVRRADRAASEALRITQPDAVCFYAMTWLALKRLAHVSRTMDIPTLCYQHGGAYGTHDATQHEQIEFSHADYFLSYGPGIRPRPEPSFAVTARFVPVGSARIAGWRRERTPRNRKKQTVRLLWIAEISTRNTYGSTFQMEDIERYRLERECLSILSEAPGVEIVFRPPPPQVSRDGITRWLRRERLRNATVDTITPMQRLLDGADLVVTDSTSGTSWNEAMALERPLVVYCDPSQTPLLPDFAADLARACCWCRTADELLDLLRRFTRDPAAVIGEMRQFDPGRFLQKYVLHEGEAAVVSRVASLMRRIGEPDADGVREVAAVPYG